MQSDAQRGNAEFPPGMHAVHCRGNLASTSDDALRPCTDRHGERRCHMRGHATCPSLSLRGNIVRCGRDPADTAWPTPEFACEVEQVLVISF